MIESMLKEYLEQQLRDQGDDVDLLPDDDLVLMGVDSIAYVRLLADIERRFGYRVPDSDVTVENFGSIESIAGYLRSAGISEAAG